MREYVELQLLSDSVGTITTLLREVPESWIPWTHIEKESLLSTRHAKFLENKTFRGLFASRIISLSLPNDVHASVPELPDA